MVCRIRHRAIDRAAGETFNTRGILAMKFQIIPGHCAPTVAPLVADRESPLWAKSSHCANSLKCPLRARRRHWVPAGAAGAAASRCRPKRLRLEYGKGSLCVSWQHQPQPDDAGDAYLVESAGVSRDLAGRPANTRSIACMNERGVDLSGHISRWIGDVDLGQFRWIVCVGHNEANKVRAALGAVSASVIVANEHEGGILDPWRGKGGWGGRRAPAHRVNASRQSADCALSRARFRTDRSRTPSRSRSRRAL